MSVARAAAAGLRPDTLVLDFNSASPKAKREAVARAESGEARLVIGTHALIQDGVRFANLGLAVVDEQHRFGVAQRLALRGKAAEGDAPKPADEKVPHQLMMSATPIPRTLAMTYYADLEVSVIDELPPGRTPIVTKVFADGKRETLLDEGAQVYVGDTPNDVRAGLGAGGHSAAALANAGTIAGDLPKRVGDFVRPSSPGGAGGA